jgi:hypothetical protein
MSNLKFKFHDGELVYCFELNSDVLTIAVINKTLHDFYIIDLKDGDDIFKNHLVMSSSMALYQTFSDLFKKKDPTINLSHFFSDGVDGVRVAVLQLELTDPKARDTITLNLPIQKKELTQQQVIDRIDYQFEKLEPQMFDIIERVGSRVDQLEPRLLGLVEVFGNGINAEFTSLHDDIRSIKQELDYMDMRYGEMFKSSGTMQAKLVENAKGILELRATMAQLSTDIKEIKTLIMNQSANQNK